MSSFSGGRRGSQAATLVETPAHGITVSGLPEPVNHDGLSGQWRIAVGDNRDNQASYFETLVTDTDNLAVTKITSVTTNTPHGFSAGDQLFLADVGKGQHGTQYTVDPNDSLYKQWLGSISSPTQAELMITRPPVISGLVAPSGQGVEMALEQYAITSTQITNGIVLVGIPQTPASIFVRNERMGQFFTEGDGYTYAPGSKTISFSAAVQGNTNIGDPIEIRYLRNI